MELNVADVRVSDFQLETGAISETVSVVADTLVVKTVGGEVAGLVTGEQVRELPLNGRNFLQLALLMPGVSAPDGLNIKDKGLLSGSDMSVSGGAITSNLWTVDGANNNDVGSNRTILVYPSRRRDRRVQDPPQQLRRGVRPGRRGPDQHRDPRRHQRRSTAAPTTSAAGTP